MTLNQQKEYLKRFKLDPMTRYYAKDSDGNRLDSHYFSKIEAERDLQESPSQKGSISSPKRDIGNPKRPSSNAFEN